MIPLDIFLIIMAVGLVTVLVIIAAIVTYNHVIGGKHKCDGKPYDTLDSEEWFAKCGKVAPHNPHMFREYERNG